MIFDDFLKGREGDRSQDMNIYTFLVDLDVLSPFSQESRLVSRPSGSQIQNYGGPSPGAGPVGCFERIPEEVCGSFASLAVAGVANAFISFDLPPRSKGIHEMAPDGPARAGRTA